jgi:methylenetetrahydrofolate dehydrogenase (NADP+)/methenyltetrahydrofolate cyclohydrolase
MQERFLGAIIIDGRVVADRLRQRIATFTTQLRERGVIPGLAVVLVGDDPASHLYVRNKTRRAQEVGIRHFDHQLPATTSTAELLELVGALNARADVHGILVQLPLPAHVDSAAVLARIDPAKDVDGFHAMNAGRLALGQPATLPCTPMGCIALIREVLPDLTGKRALVIGRSNIVGKPMAQLLLQQDCTVTIAHSRSLDLPALCAQAEILVAAIGRAQAIAGAWIRPGAVVIDVGSNRIVDAQGKATSVGDVEFAAASQRALAITPVPGGVGPMTIAGLLLNTANAAARTALGPATQLLNAYESRAGLNQAG